VVNFTKVTTNNILYEAYKVSECVIVV